MTPTARRPNILAFIPHDLGDTLACYGHRDVRSPNLDALAARGVRFTNCFTTCPECTSSRSGLWSGLHVHQNGLMGLANFGWSYFPHVAPLPRRLHDGGYNTHLFGVQHETAGDPHGLGYEHVHTAGDTNADTVCGQVAEFLRDGGGAAEPWFACAGFRDVHRVWKPETTFDPDALSVPPYLPDSTVVREDLALFYQAIEDLDAAVGRVLDELQRSGEADNTLVLFTTDHGAGFPRAKATLYDPGLRVPLIMQWPAVIAEGQSPGCLLSNIDVTPTLLEAAGCAVPEGLAGRSFFPLLAGGDYGERDAVHGGLFYDVSYDPVHFVRTRTHKYIRSFAVTDEDARGADPDVLCTFEEGTWIRVDDYDVRSSPTWRSIEKTYPKPPPEELYDLRADPWEQNNLAGAEQGMEGERLVSRGPILDEMRNRLQAFMEATDSPLLRGHVPPPPKQRDAFKNYRPGGPMDQKRR